jgi:hypothetical protein
LDLPELYDLIRKEPVCLFIGSGFSLYAGIPSAGGLKQLLYESLTANQQQKIDLSKDLQKFTEDFQVLFGRPKLIRLLQQHIDIAPSDTHLHDLLGKIAYFKSIITTNYDHLIENGFGNRAKVIINNQQVFGSKQAKTRILKIHGDIRNGKSIVITSADYASQYNRLFKDPFWATVISEISAQHIIFLGYGYEDENVWADFEYIESKLKNKDKKRILISPGDNALKRLKLKKLKMDYIRADGEIFLSGLVSAIKANLAEDHRQGTVDTQTAQDFITAFDYKVDISATKDSTQLTNISKTCGPTQHSIKFSSSNRELIQSYKEFTTGYTIRDLQIKPEQLDSFAFLIEDFTFMDKYALAHLNVSHKPKYDGICQIRFPEKQFTLHKLKCRLFNTVRGKVLIEFEVAGFNGEFSIEIGDGKAKFNFKIAEPETPAAINKSYEVFRAFYLFFSGEKAEIVPKQGQHFQHRLTEQTHAKEFKRQMEFFHTLKKIEKIFQVKFPPVSPGVVTEEEREQVNKLKDLIDHGYYAIKQADGLIIEQMPNSRKVFEAFRPENIVAGSYVSLVTKSNRDMTLFDQHLGLGAEQISMMQPSAAELNFEELRLKLVPIDDVLVYHYQKFGLWEFKGSQTLWP